MSSYYELYHLASISFTIYQTFFIQKYVSKQKLQTFDENN